jgi:hypothetical protein
MQPPGRRCIRWLLWMGCAWVGLASAQPRPVDTFSGPRGQELSQTLQRLGSSQAGSAALRDAASLPAERLQERKQLLQAGEAALARLDPQAAQQNFERAAAILHAADTEMAIVRAHMQAGEYRRALAFGAHTAGAHLDVVGGTALYAWLLHAGGQAAVAQRLLQEADQRAPSQPLITEVRAQINSGQPRAHAALRTLPVRLAPYGDERGLPKGAKVWGSAVLLRGGTHALVPLVLLPRSGRVWLRNGLGHMTAASAVERYPTMGLALLQLRQILPVPNALVPAARDAFPGSVAYAVEYTTAPDAAPAWPLLRTGFLGGSMPANAPWPDASRALGLDMTSGPRGGPVFNATGQWVGIAVQGPKGATDRWVTVSALKTRLAQRANVLLGPGAQSSDAVPLTMDQIYEVNLTTTLQVIAARR